MTVAEFEQERGTRPCRQCGKRVVDTQLNPNNNGLLVRCAHCGSNRPWGSLLYLKQNERRRPRRPPLPDGQTLDSIWKQFDNRCILCGAPKAMLTKLGIGCQVHHVAPYAEERHRGRLVPICTHCHSTATYRQRMYWYIRRQFVLQGEEDKDDRVGSTPPDAEAHVAQEGQLF